MTADPLAEVLAAVLREEKGLTDRPYEYDGNMHSWRCEYPDIYGPCGCFAETVTSLTTAVRAYLVEHVAKSEVVEAVASVIDFRTGSHMGVESWHPCARAALAVLLETLGGESNG